MLELCRCPNIYGPDCISLRRKFNGPIASMSFLFTVKPNIIQTKYIIYILCVCVYIQVLVI